MYLSYEEHPHVQFVKQVSSQYNSQNILSIKPEHIRKQNNVTLCIW